MRQRLPITIEMVDRQMAAILREKTEAERLQIAWGMWSFARTILWNVLKSEHSDWSDEQIQQEVARRLSHGACNFAHARGLQEPRPTPA